jgi:thiol-disulfide isomerase/thioredoxin
LFAALAVLLSSSVAWADTFQTVSADQIPAKVRQGMGVRLVHVWATWCGPCVGEFDRMDEVTTELSAKGLSVVAVSVDRADGPLNAFLDDKSTRWRHYRLSSASGLAAAIAELDGRYGGLVPYNLLLDADGSVLASWSGTTSEKTLRARIEPHLTGGSSGPTAAQLAAVNLGLVTFELPGREGDPIYIDNWQAGTLPLQTEIIGGLHDLRVEGDAGTLRIDQFLLDFVDGQATVDLSQLGGTVPAEG